MTARPRTDDIEGKQKFEAECGVSCQPTSACSINIDCDVAQGHAWKVVFMIMMHPLAPLVGLILVMTSAKQARAMTVTA